MVASSVAIRDEFQPEPPDIFRAAANDDAAELERAIAAGQSLDLRHREFAQMTPMHLACSRRAMSFLDAALNHEFNAWSRDVHGRLSMDHAVAQGLEGVADRLLERLYPVGPDNKPVMPFS